MKSSKKRLLVTWVFVVNSFFLRAKYTRFVAREHLGDPHGKLAYLRARHDVHFYKHPNKCTPRQSKGLNTHIFSKRMH
jgi:hypothetical protein